MTASTVETTTPTVQVGDFFVSSWGYDQTNVDFYKVVGITPSGKSVKVQKWTMSDTGEGGIHDSVVPSDGPVMERKIKSGVTQDEYFEMDFWDRQEATEMVPSPVMTKRIQSYGGDSVYFSVNSYSSASKWSGQPMYQTGSGYGH